MAGRGYRRPVRNRLLVARPLSAASPARLPRVAGRAVRRPSASAATPGATARPGDRLTEWTSAAGFAAGTAAGVARRPRPAAAGRAGGAADVPAALRRAAAGSRRGPRPGFGLTELIASWYGHHARRHLDRGRGARPRRGRRHRRAGTRSAAGPPATPFTRRTCVPAQADDLGRSTSTPGRRRRRPWPVVAAPGDACCARPARDAEPPVDTSARWPRGCRTSSSRGDLRRPGVGRGHRARRAALLPDGRTAATTRSGAAAARRGARRPRRRWCSATTTRCRRPRPTRWVPAGHADPWVDHAARTTYDDAYDGTGNWPFNTAYAAAAAPDDAFVTRLRDLREAERLHRRRHPAGRLDRVRRRASSTARRSRRPTATCW